MNDYQNMKIDQLNKMDRDILNELDTRTLHRRGDEKFMDPRDRRPDVVAEADANYKKLMMQHYNSNNEQEGLGYFDHKFEQFYKFRYIHQYLKLQTGHTYEKQIF